MSMMFIKPLALLSLSILFLLSTKITFCQVKEIKVKKIQLRDPIFFYEGEKLVVQVKLADTTITSSDHNYYLKQLYSLPDSVKLVIIGELLKYKYDTSDCALKVYGYNYNGYEVICSGTPRSNRFTIQIDALFMINKIVAEDYVPFCSCFPVIVITQTGEEINRQPKFVEKYYATYENWYKKSLEMGKLGAFEFNTPQFSWFNAQSETFTK